LLPLDNQYNYNHLGSNVDVYVLDTGIYLEHNEFGGRATCAQDHYPSVPGVLNCNDANGHGTHVAGTIGGSSYGVAKGVNLKAVKVLNDKGRGSNSAIIAGINYVIQQKTASPTTPMVINMSLGGSRSQALNDAVNIAVQQHNIVVVAAAGNENVDACGKSPASAESALTVGSTDQSDLKSDFSNWGNCLHIWAPGSDILSASKQCATCSSTLSGTSMAAPHVAAVAALVLEQNPDMTAVDVRSRITIDDASTFNLPPYKFLLKQESL
jgi:subtilisin family serine protease